jgi:ribonuclease BN (tRNA processing enzyme)
VAAAQAPALRAFADAVGVPVAGAAVEATEAGDGWNETRDGLAVRAGAVSERPLPGLAFRFEAGPATLVVSGTGPAPDRLAEFARGAGLLATEGFFRESVDLVIEAGDPDADRLRREADLHLPLPEAGAVAARAGVPLLVLTRLRPPPFFDEQYRTAAGAGFDGRVVVAGECDSFGGAPTARR